MTETQTPSKSSNKRTLILLVVAFVLPVVLAKLALDNDWFNKSATNHGELLNPAVDFSSLNETNSKRWRVAYFIPAECNASCENALYSLNQIWVALGKHQDRVEPLVIWTANSDSEQVSKVAEQPHFSVLMADEQNVNKVFHPIATDGIFLIDTLDNVILRYPVAQEKQQAVMKSRDILADLRKLLKLSRIG